MKLITKISLVLITALFFFISHSALAYGVGVNYATPSADFVSGAFIKNYNNPTVRDTVRAQLQTMANTGANLITTPLWFVNPPSDSPYEAWRLVFPPSAQELANLKQYVQDVAAISTPDGHYLNLQLTLLWLGCADFTLTNSDGTVGFCNYPWSTFINLAKQTIDSVFNTVGDLRRADGQKAVQLIYLNGEIDTDTVPNDKNFLSDLYPYFISKAPSGITPSIYLVLGNERNEAAILDNNYTDSTYHPPVLNNHRSIKHVYDSLMYMQSQNLPWPNRLDISVYPQKVNSTYAALVNRISRDINAVFPNKPWGVAETWYPVNSSDRQNLGHGFINSVNPPQQVIFWPVSQSDPNTWIAPPSFDFQAFSPNTILPPPPAPTATLTVNGTSSDSVAVGSSPHYEWHSTNTNPNTDQFSTTYTVPDPQDCSSHPTPGTHIWYYGNSANGETTGSPNTQTAGCTFVFTYKVTRADGQTASASMTVVHSTGNVQGASTGPSSDEDSSGLNFTVHAVVLDGDGVDLVQTAVANSVNFINTHSRLHLSYTISTSALPHTLNEVPCQSGTCVELRKENLPPDLISSLPIADMYIFFYKTNYRTTGKGPSAAGSTYGIELNVGGTLHSYASIASDPWWFIQELDKKHIITHETINELDGILHIPPYFCTQMYGDYSHGRTPEEAEGGRLALLDDSCYQKIEQFHNPSPIIPPPTPPPSPLPPTPIPPCAQLTHNFGRGTSDVTTGSEVSKVQQFLISKGYLVMPADASIGTFGKLTQGALSAFQASVGISPDVGYFGPVTQTKIRELTCVITPPSSTPPGNTHPPKTVPPAGTPPTTSPRTSPTGAPTPTPTSTPRLCSTRGCVSEVFNAIDEILAQKNTYGLTADTSKALDWLWGNASEILTGSR